MPKFAIVRADRPDHPNRCQATVANGQCPNLAYQAPDGTFPAQNCVMHGAHGQALAYQTKTLRNYHIKEYSDRIQDFVNNPQVKSLREEIGLLRILVEKRFNAVKDEFDLIAASGPISELISKIERTVRTCAALEAASGQTMDRQAVMALADSLLNAVINNVDALNLSEDTTSNLMTAISTDFARAFKGDVIGRIVKVVDETPKEDEPNGQSLES